ncbi:class I adenylate-forming enzyme family protein [Reinekea blandensis]|uniref:AMP-dependent synthetase and ligase n=1 Tax=Reinekea blandensis MED297 TaxID=314283 RepID=A4BIT8_9GAMM|nr:class I adenylate-forming enzyme family protein [Reinekea blandensis]EAR07955.1 AMP-dependent synthetase and ligase [Reinekea sp. MED297] [Reinekea blandensis MED297]
MFIPDQVWLRCEQNPNAVAVEHGNSKLTYGQLADVSSRYASRLNNLGLARQERVVICLENSIEYVVVFYAIWRLGGIVVPVNARSTATELALVVRQCSARLIVTSPAVASTLSKSLPESVEVETIEPSLDLFASLGLTEAIPLQQQVPLSSDDIAQILYTSGTTGDPKGVVLSHENLAINTDDIVRYLQLNQQDRVLTILPFHFSYGNSVLHTHLVTGGTVIVGFQMVFPQQVVDGLRQTKATGFSGVPTTFRSLVKLTDIAQFPPPLRYVTQAGGAMGVDLTQQLLAALDARTRLFVMYGQTEAAARITYLPPEKLNDKMGSAGHALEHIVLSIRDDDQRPCATGCVGEVYAQGGNIMQGYWQNPEASACVLTKYGLKTGDLGYLDADGYLFITGRKVDMIKVAENRINPLEIEEVICQSDSILEAAVIGVEDERTGQRLVACCVSRSGQGDSLMVKRHCAQQLVGYKVPREVVWLDQLPKTASGKIQRFKLLEQLQGLCDA